MSSIGYFLNAVANYHDSVEIDDLVLDKKQSPTIAWLVYNKINELNEVLNNPFQIPEKFPLFYLTCAIGSLGAVWGIQGEKIEKYSQNYSKDQTTLTTYTWKIVLLTYKGGYQLIQHVDKLLNVACGIYYLSQLRFGFKSSSVVGLAGLSLIGLKQSGRLPERIERYLKEAVFWADMARDLTDPKPLGWKALNLFFKMSPLTQRVAFAVNFFFPQWIQAPGELPGVHVVTPVQIDRNKSDQLEKFKQQLQALNIRQALSINSNYVYSNVMGSLLVESDDAIPTVQEKDALFDQIAPKIASLNKILKDRDKIQLTNEELEGIENLKSGLEGKLAGTTPEDIDFFIKIVSGCLKCILKDEEDFACKIRQFAQIGLECPEGWTRDVSRLYNPESTEINWCVHMSLAKWREAVLVETTNAITRGNIVLKMISGGNNDVHFIDGIHMATRHRIRTYQSEVREKLCPSTLFERFVGKITLSNNQTAPRLIDRFIVAAGMGLSSFTVWPGFFKKLTLEIEKQIFRRWDGGSISDELEGIWSPVDRHIDVVFDAIYPQYKQVLGEDNLYRNALLPRKIDIAAVNLWIQDIDKRVNGEDSDQKEIVDFFQYIKQDLLGTSYLTKEGVRMLLWDLGIIQVHN